MVNHLLHVADSASESFRKLKVVGDDLHIHLLFNFLESFLGDGTG